MYLCDAQKKKQFEIKCKVAYLRYALYDFFAFISSNFRKKLKHLGFEFLTTEMDIFLLNWNVCKKLTKWCIDESLLQSLLVSTVLWGLQTLQSLMSSSVDFFGKNFKNTGLKLLSTIQLKIGLQNAENFSTKALVAK